MGEEKLPRPSWKECVRVLRKDGWFEVRQRGDHHYFKHSSKSGTITVPERQTLSVWLVKSIIRQVGLTNEGFLELLRG